MTELRIQTVLRKVVAAFKECGLQPPSAIFLSNHADGLRILSDLPVSQMYATDPDRLAPVKMPDGSTWDLLEIGGVKVCWPMSKYARPDGGI